MQRSILQLESSSQILRQKARELTVEEVKSDKIQSLIREMKDIMRNAPGVGLAAPQIGDSIQLAVIEDSKDMLKNLSQEVLDERVRTEVPFHVIINPKIIQLSGNINYFFEGCLSIKGKARVTPRHHEVKVECLDENGKKKIILAQGWYTRILQHEIGHLNGQLYVDLSDPRTEVVIDEEYKRKWLNATGNEIFQFFKIKCPDCDIESGLKNSQLKY